MAYLFPTLLVAGASLSIPCSFSHPAHLTGHAHLAHPDELPMAEDLDQGIVRHHSQSIQSRLRPSERRSEALGTFPVAISQIGFGPKPLDGRHAFGSAGSIPATGVEVGELLDRPHLFRHIGKEREGRRRLLGAEVG